ncbi:MAG: Radical SAM additional 4Fe4S-binding domain protein [Parcubacteria group bacterium GW2011_GWA2_42_11]|nr:MAG: Radical SAM additional 4Fe4S-binding domain protein [Parcubacteria group bacterium GW2011_GWA2_42_11]KKT76457.1 MAG: Radical SAM additional 4Fe4S-binding domain protein [Parcubacteria group bacterium GW2011_GWF2_44_7]
MYPVLKDSLVRGSANDFYLQNYKKGKEFALGKEQAEILWYCNGEHTIEWLSRKFSQPEEDLTVFLKVVEKADLLELCQERSKKDFPPLCKNPFLQDVQIELTGRCNLLCKHCYGKKAFHEASKNELTNDELCDFFEQMRDLNVSKCFLSGGESFLRKDLPELIVNLAKNYIFIGGIFTNGTIFRPDVFDAIIQVGMKPIFLVSLDGPNSEIHDFIRGDGQFKKTVSFIKKTVDKGFRVTVNTVVMKPNVKWLISMRNFLEDLGIFRWRLSVPREQGETIRNKLSVVPDWSDILDSYKSLLSDILDKPCLMRVQLSSIFKTEYLEAGVYYLYHDDSCCCEYKRWSLTLTANGKLISCPTALGLPLGDIRQTALSDVWYASPTQALKTLPLSKTDCFDCEIRRYCGGGCRIMAWKIHNNILAKDDNACPLYDFFCRVIKPVFELNGIEPRLLNKPISYDYDIKILNNLFLNK